MKALFRACRIGKVMLRYRLDTLLDGTAVERWLRLAKPFVPRISAEIVEQSRGRRLRLALQELGPIFVKFGQILSTRRDLVPQDIGDELVMLQDRVEPFEGQTARSIIETALGKSVESAFAHFDTVPLASASISQVHAATLHDRRAVVVKVLRPDIEHQISDDIALLKSLATLVEHTHPNADKIRPREIVAEIETTLAAELDLQREGANASVLRRFWEASDDIYVPEVIWSHTAERVLTLERMYGIPSDDIALLDASGIDRKALSSKGIRVFYTQVFRDNFSMPMRTLETFGSTVIRHANPIHVLLCWISASWANCRRKISTIWQRISWPSSIKTTGESLSCMWKQAGYLRMSALRSWKQRHVQSVNHTLRGLYPRSRLLK